MTGAVALVAACAAMAALAFWAPRARAWFASVRTAVWLLSLLAAMSVVGVVIGQRLSPETYIERYGAGFGAFLMRSGLASVFQAWYFLLAVWALALSILSCSVARARVLMRSRRHRRRGLATLVTHVSIIIILAGGILTGIAGFKRASPRFLGSGDVIEISEGGFELRVEEARTEFSESGALSEYVSVVTIIENGREIGERRIEVNHPLVHNGVGVFQFEMLPAADSVEEVLLGVALPRPGEDDLLLELAAAFREEVAVPGTGLSVKVMEFYADFTYDIERGTAELASVWHENPAVLVQVSEAGRVVGDRWLLDGFRGHGGDREMPCRLFLLEYRPDYTNGLTRFEFSHQPGTPLLYVGFAALSLSLCFSLGPRRKMEKPS